MRTTIPLIAIMLLGQSSLTAQAVGMGREFKPESCPAADSLLGRSVPKARQAIKGLYSAQAAESMVFSADPWAVNANRPLQAIWVTTHFPGDGPVREPALGLQLRLQDSVLREGPEARISLQFDSAAVQGIGLMQVQQFGSGGRKVDQVLTIGLTAAESRQLASASRVHAFLGGLTFDIPERVQEQIRSVYVASACGVKLR